MANRFEVLLNLYLDDAIDCRELAELKQLLQRSPQKQLEFKQQYLLHNTIKPFSFIR